MPAQRRHSVLASGAQQLTDDLKLSSSVVYSERKAIQNFYNPAANRFHSEPTSENLNSSIDLSWRMKGSWYLDLSGAYSFVNGETDTTGTTAPRKRKIDSDLWTTDPESLGTGADLAGWRVDARAGRSLSRREFQQYQCHQWRDGSRCRPSCKRVLWRSAGARDRRGQRTAGRATIGVECLGPPRRLRRLRLDHQREGRCDVAAGGVAETAGLL